MRASDPTVPGWRALEAGRLAGVVHIVSGSFGSGHDAAAGEIERRLRDVGVATRLWDVVDLMPGAWGRALRAAYLRQMTSVPRSWGRLLEGLERHRRFADLVASLVGAAAPRIEQLARDERSAGFVSTHPFASQALGALRADGRLRIPALTYLTDMSVHRLWVHPGIDRHLAIHELPAASARRQLARDVTVVRPAVPPRFHADDLTSVRRSKVRAILGLPEHAPLALLTGGSNGIGELEAAADEVAATGVAVPVVLYGRNQSLRRRLQRHGRVVALGWVDDVAGLLSVVDVVIQNAGGFTSLESLATGVPVLSYRCIPGHGEANAAALDSAGLVPWVRGVDELPAGLLRALTCSRDDRAAPSAQVPEVTTAILDLIAPALRASELTPV